MNAPRFVASIAVLVVAAFWAVVLLEYLGSIGEIILLVTPFIVFFVIGIYGLIDALAFGSSSRAGSGRGSGRVGALGMTVLKMMADGKNQQEIAAATSVALITIEGKVDALKRAGYLQDDGLSERGFDLVRNSS